MTFMDSQDKYWNSVAYRKRFGHPRKWVVAPSALLAVTSFLWAALLVWIAQARIGRRDTE